MKIDLSRIDCSVIVRILNIFYDFVLVRGIGEVNRLRERILAWRAMYVIRSRIATIFERKGIVYRRFP